MFKVWVLGVGETTYATNALDFDTIEEAQEWGNGLMARWFGADKFAVLRVDDLFTGYLEPQLVETNKEEVLQ